MDGLDGGGRKRRPNSHALQYEAARIRENDGTEGRRPGCFTENCDALPGGAQSQSDDTADRAGAAYEDVNGRRHSIAAAGIAHERLDISDRFGGFGGEDLAARVGDEHVILNAYADVVQPLRDVAVRADVESRLDGEGHAG